jgi:predicted MPP superfamily phosphohydrolase
VWHFFSSAFLLLYLLIVLFLARLGRRRLVPALVGRGRWLWYGGVALLASLFPIARLLGDLLPRTVDELVTDLGLLTAIGLFYVFMGVLLLGVSRRVWRWLRAAKGDDSGAGRLLRDRLWAAGLVLGTVGLMAYGHWEARNPRVVEYVLELPTAAAVSELHLVVVSDVHYGDNIDLPRLEQLRALIEPLEPDLIILAGDLLEGNDQRLVEELSSFFASLPSRYGVVAVPGNHDRALLDREGAAAMAMRASGIDLLQDERRLIAASLWVVGRDDYRRRAEYRAPVSALLSELDHSKAVLLLDHQPVELSQAAEAGADLFVAGHTHGGQVFPAQLFTWLIYGNDHGLSQVSGMNLLVSSGYGTWGPDLRIGAPPEVVSLRLRFLGAAVE